MQGLFNTKKHSDVIVEATGGEGGQTQIFYLHKFPLISKSTFFAEYFEKLDEEDEEVEKPSGPPTAAHVHLENFPGGPTAFEVLARHCYGESAEVTVANVAYLFAGARFLRIIDVSRSTESFMLEKVLPAVPNAVVVLAAATRIEDQPDTVMVDLVGRCINTISAHFESIPELQLLPPDCFSCLVRTARDMECPKPVLQEAVIAYTQSRIDPTPAPSKLAFAEFHEVTASCGTVDDMLFAESVYRMLEILLGEITEVEGTELCTRLNDIGLFACLPHAAIEAAYANKAVPDRFVTVSLMSENRHLLKLNDGLADQVEELKAMLLDHGLEPPRSEFDPPAPLLLDSKPARA